MSRGMLHVIAETLGGWEYSRRALQTRDSHVRHQLFERAVRLVQQYHKKRLIILVWMSFQWSFVRLRPGPFPAAQ